MSLTLTVSFHGGKQGVNNLLTVPGDDTLLDPSGVTLDELRGFTLGPAGDDHLYVAVANKNVSQILRFDAPARPGARYTNGEVFASSHLHHPFAVVFGPDNNLYVSNQDASSSGKIRITKYDASGSYLGDFADGFLVLRGLAWAGNTLYVADEQGGPNGTGAVTPYDISGKPGAAIEVPGPVHVMYDGARYLYIGAGSDGSVYMYDTQEQIAPNPAVLLASTPAAPIGGTAGIAVTSDEGTTFMFVANRKGMAINRYVLDATKTPPAASDGEVWAEDLPDTLEFVAPLGGPGTYG